MKIKVGVFAEKKNRGNGIKCRAYTISYNPRWSGCNEVIVDALNRIDARKVAIEIIKRRYLDDPDSVRVV